MAFALLALLCDIWVSTCTTSVPLGCHCSAWTCAGGRGRLAAKHPILLRGSHSSCEEASCSSEGFRLDLLSSWCEALNPVCLQLCQWTGRWGGGCSNHLLPVEGLCQGCCCSLTNCSIWSWLVEPSFLQEVWSCSRVPSPQPPLKPLSTSASACAEVLKPLNKRAWVFSGHFLSYTTVELQKTIGQTVRSLPTSCSLMQIFF